MSGVGTDDEKRAILNENTTTFLLVAQQIPFTLPDGVALDWEHLFPTARGDENLKWKGADGTWKLQRHPDSWCIGRAGRRSARNVAAPAPRTAGARGE